MITFAWSWKSRRYICTFCSGNSCSQTEFYLMFSQYEKLKEKWKSLIGYWGSFVTVHISIEYKKFEFKKKIVLIDIKSEIGPIETTDSQNRSNV